MEKYQNACASVQPRLEKKLFPLLNAENEYSPWQIRPI